MKIGISTMPLDTNYGGILQNYALQKVLKDMGHDVMTVRYPVSYQNTTYIQYARLYAELYLRHIVKRILGRNSLKPLTKSQWNLKVENFENFIAYHINTTGYIKKLNLDFCEQHKFDMLVVGSDQIWRPEVLNFMCNYFCDFAKDSEIKRISYAASLALDKWTFSEKQTRQIKELLKNFSAISVREESSLDLINKNTGCKATWVLDPTMLLQKSDYLQLINEYPRSSKKFIFAYLLDSSENKLKVVKDIAKKQNADIISLDDKGRDENQSIEKWLSYFRDASFIVTDSFHGTVFSIIFEKDFFCMQNLHRGNARMESLKRITGLDERFIDEQDNLTESSIDYIKIRERISKARESSLSFLNDNIG